MKELYRPPPNNGVYGLPPFVQVISSHLDHAPFVIDHPLMPSAQETRLQSSIRRR